MLAIGESGALVGAAAWREAQCFELLGRWVRLVPEPDVKVMLARHSRHHGWHAELLVDVLPSTRDHDPTGLVAPGEDGWVGALAVARGDDATPTVERLAGVYQSLLPRMVAGYDEALDRTSPWSDGPAARILRLVVDDERADLAEGLVRLEELAGAERADRVADRRAEVEAGLGVRASGASRGGPGR